MRVRSLLLLGVLVLPLAAQPDTQPAGALTGRIVFIGAGHGWTFANESASPRWYTQRGVANGMVEDYGNLDQMNLFAGRWDPEAPRVLLVDAFDRQDRFLNPRQILQGPVIERVQPARSNGRDSLVEHALALAAPQAIGPGPWRLRASTTPGRLHQLQTWSGHPSDTWIDIGPPRLAEEASLEFNLPEPDAPVLLFRLLRDHRATSNLNLQTSRPPSPGEVTRP